MKRLKAGYTTLEVIIFLAISGGMFALIYPSFSNRQDKVRFSQSVRDVESKISDVINDVSTGYFPGETVYCSVSGTGDLDLSSPSPGSTQGTRQDCIFIGKSISSTYGNLESLDISTVVGKRKNAAGERVTTLADAKPLPVRPPFSNHDLTEVYGVKGGVQVNKIRNLTMPVSDIIGFGAFISLGSTDSTKKVDIVPINSANGTPPFSLNLGTENPPNGILVCVSDIKTSQKAAIVVGGQSGVNKTKIVFDKAAIDAAYGANVCD